MTNDGMPSDRDRRRRLYYALRPEFADDRMPWVHAESMSHVRNDGGNYDITIHTESGGSYMVYDVPPGVFARAADISVTKFYLVYLVKPEIYYFHRIDGRMDH